MAVLVGGFTGRDNLGNFLNGLSGLGLVERQRMVEVGTHRGDYAVKILTTWFGSLLLCVDHWQPGYDPQDPVSYSDRNDDYRCAKRALKPFLGRYQFLKMSSKEATGYVPDSSVAAVYLDGCHQQQAVAEDLRLWWPKVVQGGIIAGHDFICTNEVKGGWGQYVQPAVMQFACEVGRNVHVIAEVDGSPWSFYIVK